MSISFVFVCLQLTLVLRRKESQREKKIRYHCHKLGFCTLCFCFCNFCFSEVLGKLFLNLTLSVYFLLIFLFQFSPKKKNIP